MQKTWYKERIRNRCFQIYLGIGYDLRKFSVQQWFLRRVCPVLQPPWEQKFHCKNEQHADAGCGYNLDDKIKETAKAQPFQEDHIGMMEQCKDESINSIRGPLHGFR